MSRSISEHLRCQGSFLIDYAPGPCGEFLRVVVNVNTTRRTIEGMVARIEEIGKEVK